MSKKLTAFALLVLLSTIGFTGCAKKKCECLCPSPVQASSLGAAEPADSRQPSSDLARKRYIK